MIKTHLRCHSCGYDMDTAECLWNPAAEVRKGDLTMCLNCGMIYQSEGKDKWRRLTRRERRALDKGANAQLAVMQSARARVITQDLALDQMFKQASCGTFEDIPQSVTDGQHRDAS